MAEYGPRFVVVENDFVHLRHRGMSAGDLLEFGRELGGPRRPKLPEGLRVDEFGLEHTEVEAGRAGPAPRADPRAGGGAGGGSYAEGPRGVISPAIAPKNRVRRQILRR